MWVYHTKSRMASGSIIDRILDALTIKGLVVKLYRHSADKLPLDDILVALPDTSRIAVVCSTKRELEEIEKKCGNVTGLTRLDYFDELKSKQFDLLIHPKWCNRDRIPTRCKSGEVSFAGLCLLDEQDNHKLTFAATYSIVKSATSGISSSVVVVSNSGNSSSSESMSDSNSKIVTRVALELPHT